MVGATKYGNRYPWREWMKKGSLVLKRGKDYDHSSWTMAQMIRNKVSEMNRRVGEGMRWKYAISVSDDEKSISVKFYREGEE